MKNVLITEHVKLSRYFPSQVLNKLEEDTIPNTAKQKNENISPGLEADISYSVKSSVVQGQWTTETPVSRLLNETWQECVCARTCAQAQGTLWKPLAGGQTTAVISIPYLSWYEIPLPNLHQLLQHRHILGLQFVVNSKHHNIQLHNNHWQTWRKLTPRGPEWSISNSIITCLIF